MNEIQLIKSATEIIFKQLIDEPYLRIEEAYSEIYLSINQNDSIKSSCKLIIELNGDPEEMMLATHRKIINELININKVVSDINFIVELHYIEYNGDNEIEDLVELNLFDSSLNELDKICAFINLKQNIYSKKFTLVDYYKTKDIELNLAESALKIVNNKILELAKETDLDFKNVYLESLETYDFSELIEKCIDFKGKLEEVKSFINKNNYVITFDYRLNHCGVNLSYMLFNFNMNKANSLYSCIDTDDLEFDLFIDFNDIANNRSKYLNQNKVNRYYEAANNTISNIFRNELGKFLNWEAMNRYGSESLIMIVNQGTIIDFSEVENLGIIYYDFYNKDNNLICRIEKAHIIGSSNKEKEDSLTNIIKRLNSIIQALN